MNIARCGSMACALLALVLRVSIAGAAQPIPLESFASGDAIESVDISPAGTHLLMIGTIDGARVLRVLDLATRESLAILPGDAKQFRLDSCWFKNDERILCRYRGVDHEAGQPFWVSRLYALNRDGSQGKVLVQNGRAGASQFQDRIVSDLEDDPRHVLIALDEDANIFPEVYRLDVYDGKIGKVLRDREPILTWVADQSGAVRFGYGFRDDKAQYIARDDGDAPWRTLLKFDRFDQATFGVLGFGTDPQTLIVSAQHMGRRAIWEMDLSDKGEKQLLFSHPQVDAQHALVWPGSKAIVGFFYSTDRPQRKLFDGKALGVQQAIDRLLPATFNSVIGGSRDARRLLVHAASDVNPGEFYLLDVAAGSMLSIGAANRAMRGTTLAPMKTVMIPGPGGIQIPGYLTVPPGTDGRRLPAIVLPHGGPYARDHWGYDPLLQMLVSRGYAVLQLNFRGSTGYGQDWLDAGWQAWGTVMHDDITTGARWLVESGVADPQRMCIVGWSYGGYAALIGGIKEPALYRCIVSIAGVSDLSELQEEDARFYGGRAAIREAIGKADLKANSPRRRAGEIQVPVLLVHGDADIQVLVSHSKDMDEALTQKGRRHELLLIKGGDHSLERPEWRLALYRKLEAFLAENLAAPAPAPAPAAAAVR